MVADQLNSLFGISTVLAADANPQTTTIADQLPHLTVQNTFEALRQHLRHPVDGLPLEIVCFAGFAPCSSSSDVLQVRFRPEARQLSGAAQFNDDTTALISEFPSTANLDGLLNLSGQLQVDLVFGVGSGGFYVLGTSGVGLTITGGGEVSVQDVPLAGGTLQLDATGTATIDAASPIVVSTALKQPADRYGLSVIQSAPETFLKATADGSATLSLQHETNPIELSYPGIWQFQMTQTGAEEVCPNRVLQPSPRCGNVAFPSGNEWFAAVLPLLANGLEQLLNSEAAEAFNDFVLPFIEPGGRRRRPRR